MDEEQTEQIEQVEQEKKEFELNNEEFHEYTKAHDKLLEAKVMLANHVLMEQELSMNVRKIHQDMTMMLEKFAKDKGLEVKNIVFDSDAAKFIVVKS